MVLLLFSAKYPYNLGAEQSFLNVEINHLKDTFDRVILIPRNTGAERLPLPKGVEVDDSYSKLLNGTSKFSLLKKILQSPYFYREIISNLSTVIFPSELLRLAAFIGGMHFTSIWVDDWLTNSEYTANQVIFYSYWFDQAAMGIGLVKQNNPAIRLVSRAHGYDIYAEHYYKFAYWPCREIAMSLLDCLFPDAQAGTEYLQERYPEFADKCETALLGVTEPGFLNKPSSDKVFRLVSCSMIRPEKRVQLILEGFKYAAELRPDQKFEWHHIGNGETRNILQEIADETLPSNAKVFFPGYTDTKTLMRFYHDTPLDVFVNASSTEGTPVSIMEAISCGIPVIATEVGGNKEIVSHESGVLLSKDPSPEDIAQAIFYYIDHPEHARDQRKESRKIWEEKYNAHANYRNFAEKLKAIRENK